MQIKVTQAHIDSGEHCEANACPVALAVKDVLPEVQSVSVDNFIRLTAADGTFIDFMLPEVVDAFVVAFDDYGPKRVQPFTFTLPIEERVGELGGES